jgi:hypothetical protein
MFWDWLKTSVEGHLTHKRCVSFHFMSHHTAEESPANTLEPSVCAVALDRHRKRVQQQELEQQQQALAPLAGNVPVPLAAQGIRCQLQCGCCNGRSCYWSSKGE